MSYIHPEIAKFWKGHDCFILPYCGDNALIWGIEEELRQYGCVECFSYRVDNHRRVARVAFVQPAYKVDGDMLDEISNPIYITTYYFDDNKYSEQEALRIIKLKAFI